MPRQTEITNDQKAGRRNFFQEWRKHRGLTQQQVADRMCATRSSVSRRERGQVSYSQDYLEVLADVLQTDASSLILRDPNDSEGAWSIWDQHKPGK